MRRARALLVLVTPAILLVAGSAGGAGRPSSALALSLAADESLPGWAIPLVLAAVIAAAVAVYYLIRGRKEE